MAPSTRNEVSLVRVTAAGKLPSASRVAIKSVTEIRYDNFDKLFNAFKKTLWDSFPDEPERGMLRKFSERVGFSERYVSHLNCRRKPIGHSVARKLEESHGLPTGWMDQDHSSVDPAAVATVTEAATSTKPPELQDFLSMAEEIYKNMPERAKAAIMPLVLEALRRK